MPVEVLLGNHSAIEGYKLPDNTVRYTPMPGAQIFRCLLPEVIAEDLALTELNLRKLLPKHMTAAPEWVESTSPAVAAHLAAAWTIPISRPDNWEDADAN